MPRQPDGNCWPQWLRKINAAENPRRVSSAGQWPPALAGKTAGDRLAGAAPCPRVAVSSQRAGCGKPGRMARRVAAARSGGRHPATHRRGAGAGRAGGPGENADRSALRRPVSAHAICPGDGAAGAAGDARRALHRYRRSDQSRTNGFDPRDAPAGTDHPGGAA